MKTQKTAPQLVLEGSARGYASWQDMPEYRGKILDFGLGRSAKMPGEFASLDITPVAALGFSIIGIRLQLLDLHLLLHTWDYAPTQWTNQGTGEVVLEGDRPFPPLIVPSELRAPTGLETSTEDE